MLRNLATALLVSALGVSGVSYAQTAAQGPQDPPAVLEQASPTDSPNDVPEPEVVEEEEAPEPVEQEAAEVTEEDEGESPPEGHFSTKDCPEGFTGNHGAYVSSVPPAERSSAAKSDCGKPVAAVEKADRTQDPEVEGEEDSDVEGEEDSPPDDDGSPEHAPGHAKRGGPKG